MNIAKKLTMCICLSMIFCGCDSLMSDSYSSGNNSSTKSEENEIVSSIANDIVSGIGNKIDEIGENASLTYWGSSGALRVYSEALKSDDISSEMKNSRFFKVISSIIRNDCICMERGSSFVDQDASIISFNYVSTYYNIKSETQEYHDIITAHDEGAYHFHINHLDDDLKEYFIEEVSTNDIERMTGINDILELYKSYAEDGEITGSGKETVFGKEMEYEDIDFKGETTRFYYDGQYTLYTIDAESGAYYKLTNNTNAKFRVPLGYKEVSRDLFIYDVKNKD
ncbi:MAG: hypothetical protein ACI4J0_02620 [Huintestinicola sp.]|uniref:hypothetical protein n=1 Tax=Huintestinicola sp. TaxID=2981661 RepID=UPI003F0652F1